MEFCSMARLRGSSSEPKGNQQVRNRKVRDEVRSPGVIEGHPKPVDLYLGRLKPFERKVEDRTGNDVQIFRITWV